MLEVFLKEFKWYKGFTSIPVTLNEDADVVERLVAEVRDNMEPWRRRLLSLP